MCSLNFNSSDDELSGAWEDATFVDGETVHPDGICTTEVMSNMKPILMSSYSSLSPLRFPYSSFPLIKPVADDR